MDRCIATCGHPIYPKIDMAQGWLLLSPNLFRTRNNTCNVCHLEIHATFSRRILYIMAGFILMRNLSIYASNIKLTPYDRIPGLEVMDAQRLYLSNSLVSPLESDLASCFLFLNPLEL